MSYQDALCIPRMVTFLGHLAATATEINESASQLAIEVLEDTLWDVTESCNSMLACARTRACQFLHAVLSNMKRNINRQLAVKLQEVLLERLDDKDAKTRRMAVHAVVSLVAMIEVISIKNQSTP
jgi:hypothetical protein